MNLILPALALSLCFANDLRAETNYASEQRKNAALGHYARARTMLVEALAEFEQARKYARPDMLLDPEEWRLSVISRTEELNRLLDPRPRVTVDGVRFQANKLLIRREKDRTPAVADGARDKNYLGEAERREEKRQTRARLELPEDDKVKVIPKADAEAERKQARVKAEAELSFTPQTPTPAESEVAPPVSGEEKKAASASVAIPGRASLNNKPAAMEMPKDVAEEAVSPSQESPVISDEEEVSTKAPALSEEAPLLKTQRESSSQAQTLEQKEDEVTREIERAIQERAAKGKAAGEGSSSVEEDE